MSETNTVVPFPRKEIELVVDELLSLYKQGKVKNLILTYTADEYKDHKNTIYHYWFGERSCLYVLGLIEDMKSIVLDYLRESNADNF